MKKISSSFSFRIVWAICLVLGISDSVRAVDPVVVDEFGFRFKVPAGFVPVPELLGEAGREDYIAIYFRESDEMNRPIVFLVFRRLNQKIPQRPIQAEEALSIHPSATVRREKWKDISIDAIDYPGVSAEGLPTRHLTVRIPLKREAVAVDFISEPGNETEVAALMRKLLDDFEGEIGYSPDEVDGYAILIGGVIFIALWIWLIAYLMGRASSLFALERTDVENGLLPSVCIVCGNLIAKQQKQIFYWHPWWIVPILGLGNLPYYFFKIPIRDRLEGSVPLCSADQKATTTFPKGKLTLIGFLFAFVASMLLFATPEQLIAGYVGLISTVLVIILVAFLLQASPKLRVTEIREDTITFNRVCWAFRTSVKARSLKREGF